MGTAAIGLGEQAFERGQQRREQLEDEQRKATLDTLLEDAATPADKVAAIQAVYHKDPSVLKQHVENLTRRLTGKQPQPVVSPQQAQAARLAPIAAAGQTPQQRASALEKQKEQAAYALQQLKNQGLQSRESNTRPVPYYQGAVSKANAVAAQNAGKVYLDQEGNPIDANQVPEGMFLLPVFAGGGKEYYELGTDKMRYETGGNQRLVEPAVGPPNPSAPSIGPARVPTVGTHQVPGMNPGETVTLTSTTTPQTPGAAGAPAPKPGAPGVSPAKSAKPAQQRSPAPSPQSGISAPPPPFAKGTMLTQGRNAEPVVASMNTVAAQVFGQNGEPPIWQNAWMFDNPQLRTALNRALTLNALAIPGTEDDPSFMQQLATATGLTGAGQEAIQQANVQARQQLAQFPGALEMFARMAGLQEDLSALRSATKGSAAQGSIRTLVRAAPVYNVASSQNFRDQLGVTLNTAAAAMSGYPAINPAYLDWFKKGAQSARGSKPAPQAKQSTGDPAVDQFLMGFPNAPAAATQPR